MPETEYRNLSDLFLDQASEDIENKNFKEAANLIVMALTEFDERADIVKYLTNIFEQMPAKDIECLIIEFLIEIKWLSLKPYISRKKRNRMLAFLEDVTGRFLGPPNCKFVFQEICSQIEDSKPAPKPNFYVRLEERGGRPPLLGRRPIK